MQRNPAALLFTPREAAIGTRLVMSPQQIKNLFGVLDIRERVISKFAALAGMRPGEMFGLKWGDVGDNSLEVRRRCTKGFWTARSRRVGFGLSASDRTL